MNNWKISRLLLDDFYFLLSNNGRKMRKYDLHLIKKTFDQIVSPLVFRPLFFSVFRPSDKTDLLEFDKNHHQIDRLHV